MIIKSLHNKNTSESQTKSKSKNCFVFVVVRRFIHHILTPQGKVHGSLARAGKVKSQTPKVDKQEKPKKPKGRAYMRLLYTKRFVNVTLVNGKRKANSNSA